MAGPTRIVTLNLGSQTVGMAEFFAQPYGGLMLNRYVRRELPPDIASEAARHPERLTQLLLRDMMEEMRLRRAPVNYAIAAHSVFTRFVKLPAVEEEKIERIIAFEAQQNVPFPIDEVVWDYQLVGGGPDEQVQVVLVAIKADLLDEINRAVESAGMQTHTVGMATMSLYNSFRYNYGELEGCSLLIDVGARTTNLLFIEPGKIFSRSVAIGGSSITAALAKEFNEPLVAAEFRKIRDGFVSLGGTYMEPADPDIVRVSKIVRSTMTRLHAEITRSISHYRAQQQGTEPRRVFLCGGSTGTPYMREFFHEKLQLPVEFFHALRNVSVTQNVDAGTIGKSAHLLGELVGLALRRVTTCPIELNLRPAGVVARQQLEKRRPFLGLAAACVIVALFGWGIYYSRAAQLERQVSGRLEQKIDLMRRVEAQMTQVRKETAALDAVATPLLSAVSERTFWTELLEDLNTRLPKEDIWITELAGTSAGRPLTIGASRPGTSELSASPTPINGRSAAIERTLDGLLVRGLYMFNPRQQEVAVDYFRNLTNSPFFAIDPNNQAKALKPTTPTSSEWAFPYELHLDLKKPVKLP